MQRCKVVNYVWWHKTFEHRFLQLRQKIELSAYRKRCWGRWKFNAQVCCYCAENSSSKVKNCTCEVNEGFQKALFAHGSENGIHLRWFLKSSSNGTWLQLARCGGSPKNLQSYLDGSIKLRLGCRICRIKRFPKIMVLGTFSVELSWLNIRQEARDKKISALFPKGC